MDKFYKDFLTLTAEQKIRDIKNGATPKEILTQMISLDAQQVKIRDDIKKLNRKAIKAQKDERFDDYCAVNLEIAEKKVSLGMVTDKLEQLNRKYPIADDDPISVAAENATRDHKLN